MIVTARLLKKYHAGECSPAERLFVETWLNSETNCESGQFSELDNEQLIKDEMWAGVSAFTDHEPEKRSGSVKQINWRLDFRYIAAACLFFFVIGWGAVNFSGFSQKHNVTGLAMDNSQGVSSRRIDYSGLAFTLTPKSKAETRTDMKTNDVDVNFCGNISITNNSDEDIQIRFNTSCQNSNDTQKTFTCEKGKTYLAIHYKFNNEEIMVIDKSELATAILPIQVYQELERI